MIEECKIPNAPELFDIRKQLNDLPDRTPPNYPVGIPGIFVVEKSTDRPRGEDCKHFIFQGEENASSASNRFMEKAKQTFLEPNALAYYYDEKGFAHIGRVTEDGYILSKWGPGGHVYKHLPHLVPTHYGNIIKYYKHN